LTFHETLVILWPSWGELSPGITISGSEMSDYRLWIKTSSPPDANRLGLDGLKANDVIGYFPIYCQHKQPESYSA